MMSFVLENFKKIRVVEVVLKGHVTTITGRNGQGKQIDKDGTTS